jgi:hypothetical protein
MLLNIDNQISWIPLSEASKVQSLIFDINKYTTDSAKDWASSHGFRSSKVDEKENTIRLRQQSPSKSKEYRTKEFGKGIKAVIGF